MNHTRHLTLAACGLLAAAALAACSSSGGGSSEQTNQASPPPSAQTNAAANAPATSSAGCTPAHANLQTISKGSLTVLVYVSPPYTTKDGNSYGGVDGTIVKKIAAMECLKLKESSVAPAALVASIQSKRGDVAIGGVYYTAQRAQAMSLSDPMYRDGMALLSKKSVDGTVAGLKGKKVGVVQGYLWDKDFQKALGSGNVKLYQDSAGMITDIKNGRLDAAVLTSAEAGYRAKQDSSLKVTNFASTPQIAASKSQNDVVLMSPKQSASLTKALNGDVKKLISDGSVAAALKDNGMDPALAGPAGS